MNCMYNNVYNMGFFLLMLMISVYYILPTLTGIQKMLRICKAYAF